VKLSVSAQYLNYQLCLPDNRRLHSVPRCNGATLDKHQWPLDLSERDKIAENRKLKTENRSVVVQSMGRTQSSQEHLLPCLIPDDCCEFSECI